MPPVIPSTLQVTESVEEPVMAAEKVNWPPLPMAVGVPGVSSMAEVVPGAATVTTVEEDLVGSATLVAFTVWVPAAAGAA